MLASKVDSLKPVFFSSYPCLFLQAHFHSFHLLSWLSIEFLSIALVHFFPSYGAWPVFLLISPASDESMGKIVHGCLFFVLVFLHEAFHSGKNVFGVA